MRRRAFWFALACSVLAHVALIAGLPATDARLEPPTGTISARLEQVAAPAASPTPTPTRQPLAKRAGPALVPETARPAATAQPDPMPTLAPAPSADPDPAPDPEPALAEAPTPDAKRAETIEAPSAGTPPLAIEPSSGTVTYDLVYRGGSIGRSIQTWRIENASYRLTSRSEPTGLVALFYTHEFIYTSEGRIGPAGLMPEHFTARSGRRGARRSQATFDWTRREIALQQGASTPRVLPLAEGTQDLMSFVYQLALDPLEPGTRQMVITSGTKVDTYVLSVGPEEAIDLPVGPVRAIPIRRIAGPGEESMQLWLRAASPHLPVRVQFFDRSGAMTIEQLAARIDIDGT